MERDRRDPTDEDLRELAIKMCALLAPLSEKYRIKYVISAAVQKTSEPEIGASFLVQSHPKDPMWSVQALTHAAIALKPFADEQRDEMARKAGKT